MAVLTVGLTGGIASGKTLVTDAFQQLGTPVLDGDQAARAVVAPGTPGLEEVIAAFGGEFRQADGGLDRRRMRERVFANPAELRRLESITHPRIRQYLIDWRDQQTTAYCVLAVPILIESGLDALVDRILVVDAPVETQLRRLRERDQISESLAGQMVAAQATREERLARAHDVLVNDADPAVVLAAVAKLHAFYLELATGEVRSAPGMHLP